MNEDDYILYLNKGSKVVPLSSIIDILPQVDPLILKKKVTAIVNSNNGILVIYTEDGCIYHNNDRIWKSRNESVEKALRFRKTIRNKIDELTHVLDLCRDYHGFVRYAGYPLAVEYDRKRISELEELLHKSKEYFDTSS
jgi:hypothetical protein